MVPNDKETLVLLYGKGKKDTNTSMHSMRGRNFSPTQNFLMESITSRDRLHESELLPHDHFHSPSNTRNEIIPISPEMHYENYRILSEGRKSGEDQKEMHNIEIINKPKSALSGLKSKRYFSMPRARNRSRHSINSSRSGIPTYFRDAAELLTSRILKQIKISFDRIKQHALGMLISFKFIDIKHEELRRKRIPQENIIQPYNKNEKVMNIPLQITKNPEIRSKKYYFSLILSPKSKFRTISPTEFLSNSNEYGKLKESNDTIFSFGTSKDNSFIFL